MTVLQLPNRLPSVTGLQVPSFDSRIAMLLLEKELGAPWTTFYSELSPEPIAAASLGQVRRRCMPSKQTQTFAACHLDHVMADGGVEREVDVGVGEGQLTNWGVARVRAEQQLKCCVYTLPLKYITLQDHCIPANPTETTGRRNRCSASA